jgi:hypothetical protein
MYLNDCWIVYNGIIPPDTYHKFCKMYNQNAEDGVL